MKRSVIVISIILIVLLGIFIGTKINKNVRNDNLFNNKMDMSENSIISTVEIATKEEEKTTPNTLLIYKVYYTKCNHFAQEYKDIDVSLVNLNKEEFKEKNKKWNIDKFSSEEVILSKEEEKFCNEHYKLKLENNNIVIYNVDEKGNEVKYENTKITTEYLTEQDILNLRTGIIVFGKENLITSIEDYE